MPGLAQTGIVLALCIYVPALIFYGEHIFDTDWGVGDPCDGVFDCLFDTIGHVIETVGDLFQFLTLTGLDSTQADPTFLIVYRFALGIIWLLIILGLVRGTSVGG